MTMKNKQELIAQVVTLLNAVIEVEDKPENEIMAISSQPMEMLTIKECVKEVKGLSEHTIRQLVAQDKIPHIRTGVGKRGKILISKAALLEYFGVVA